MNNAIGELEQEALGGDAEAQVALGRHHELLQNVNVARGWFARAAKLGSVPALRSLAINLLTRKPIMEADGVNMIRSAADKGDAEAAYVCGMIAAQDEALPGRWSVGRECLLRAAASGWTFAQTQLDFLNTDFSAEDIAKLTAASVTRRISDAPRIDIVENFAANEVCDWLIARARPNLKRALVYDRATGSGKLESARTNSSFEFSIAQTDLVLLLLRERIAATVGLARENLEATQVLHYDPGEQFAPHFDFLDPRNPAYAANLAAGGQRVATFLLYLNDDFEDGETNFPKIGFRYKGRKGDALLFWNVDPAGAPDRQTFHAGLPTTQGQKWLLSQWLRQKGGNRAPTSLEGPR